MTLSILNYGARLVDFLVPDAQGQVRPIILRYAHLEDYLNDTFFMGPVIGRVANRLAKGHFQWQGKSFFTQCNEGDNQLHGGDGFDKRFFSLIEKTQSKLHLRYVSQNNEAGYPGELVCDVFYQLDLDGLSVEIQAKTSQATLFNPTLHPYFNLNGKGNILDHSLTMSSQYYLPVDELGIPLGSMADSEELLSNGYLSDCIKKCYQDKKGLDHFFLKNDRTMQQALMPHALLQSDKSGISLEVWSDMPGVQVYTGQYLSSPWQPYSGICIEPHFLPNAANQHEWHCPMLLPEQSFSTKTFFKVINKR